jgi:hypothetical protein
MSVLTWDRWKTYPWQLASVPLGIQIRILRRIYNLLLFISRIRPSGLFRFRNNFWNYESF